MTISSNIIPISLEQAKIILDEFKAKGQMPAVKYHCTHGEHPYGHGIEGWDFTAEDGTILRAPPTAIPWVAHERKTWPFLFMTTRVPITLKIWNQRRRGEEEYTIRILPIGTRVRIVMASRFGDVGITDDLMAETGYHARISLDDIESKFDNFSMTP